MSHTFDLESSWLEARIPQKVLSDWELWACAQELIRQHGFDAAIFAAMRADELEEEGELDGARAYRLIVKRINETLAAGERGAH